MNFTEFRLNHKLIYNKELDDQFLTWLIGFFEGDGSFVVSNRGDIHFVISQHKSDVQILNVINENLGFGSVISQSENVSRYIVQDQTNLTLICLLFNGNLVFPKRKEQFKRFLERFNSKTKHPIDFLDRNANFDLNDAWLCGVTDAEGCFTCTFLSNSSAFRIRYLVTQKYQSNLVVLKRIISLFGVGAIEKHSVNDTYSCVISGKNNCKKIFGYFDKFILKTKKKFSYIKFKELHKEIMLAVHLDENLVLIKKASKVNV